MKLDVISLASGKAGDIELALAKHGATGVKSANTETANNMTENNDE